LKARQRAEEARFILYCGFHAGLRRSEISMARVNWFDLEAGFLHASNDSGFTSKNREIRVIPLAQEFLECSRTVHHTVGLGFAADEGLR